MKRLFILTLLIGLLFTNNIANASIKTNFTNNTKVEKTTFSDTYSIVKFFKEYEYAVNNYNHNTIKNMFGSTYLSTDGFDKNILMQIVKDTWKTYPGIKYTVKINSVNSYGNTAIADVTETTKGYSKKENDNVGEFVSTTQTIYFLEKNGKSWEITNDNTLKEHIYIWWGDAKNAPITLKVPTHVQAGDEYSAILEINRPNNVIAIGSITADKISYPQKTSDEIYRKFSSDGNIERIMRANTDNTNEYVCGTVGFSRPKIDNNQTLNVKLTGYACVMERVNIIPINKFIEVKNAAKE